MSTPDAGPKYGYRNKVSIASQDVYEERFIRGTIGDDESLEMLAGAVMDSIREIERLDALINNPHTEQFLEAVRLEAAHQQERWGSEHDAGKTDADWFWLVGYLAGKAISNPERQLHHIVTTAAALLNWHAHNVGANTSMRPGLPIEKQP